ncbi:hypothetical protein LZ496_06170 [Sphingomonas sp. NSE70-1]|uniref:PEP-CTERM protein-sorting domain-containing protein n=1 Tax=Sphingomonas caseinilyticus TaxID=2908205 RepID=A0ABT0RTL9_9SPHN|nr:hypothetical protein [Sphingomonas caseinilyticus]MCL6698367.1 hypothetical protein [Sphingomonas caseinilyticus]
MSEQQVSDTRTWGCLAVGMILFGAFFIDLFEGVGGTEYELKYTAEALIVAGAGILIVLFAKRLRR